MTLLWTIGKVCHTIMMPTDPVRVPGPSCDSFVKQAQLKDNLNPITFDHCQACSPQASEAPSAVAVTDNEGSINSDSNHPDKDDWEEDWTIPKAEGDEAPTQAQDFDFARIVPKAKL
jgi:hypothetical protein